MVSLEKLGFCIINFSFCSQRLNKNEWTSRTGSESLRLDFIMTRSKKPLLLWKTRWTFGLLWAAVPCEKCWIFILFSSFILFPTYISCFVICLYIKKDEIVFFSYFDKSKLIRMQDTCGLFATQGQKQHKTVHLKATEKGKNTHKTLSIAWGRLHLNASCN